MHDHHESGDHNHSVHAHNTGDGFKFAIVIALNIIITAAEYIGGVISGSLALISDAGHNLSDVLSLILGYTGEKVSEKKRSDSYTFGLKRFEVLIALINALTLVIIGLYIFYEAVKRFKNPVVVDFSIMLPIAVIGLAGNLISMLFLGHGNEKSLNIRAAFLHLFFDAVSSVAVIAAAVIIYYTSNYWVDIVISFFIAVMIIWSSFGILRESLRIFLQGVPEHIDSAEVYKAVLGIEKVESLHGLHIWSINSKEIFLSCHVCLDADSGSVSDEIIIEINSMLKEKFMIEHTTIQVELSDFCGGHTGECCSH
ncbi:MAG TPA: cation diffusion facilitator family transporter [Spirochaetota bacterium]|nr:cation diffusion facilitator family transporter [Spirochaetota bacterium]